MDAVFARRATVLALLTVLRATSEDQTNGRTSSVARSR